ncbi:MAG: pyruvate ferredoxin oxidoreductase [Anaerolineales bacterium]|nr:pyruvate ferredoxin oxidoreductase [Anaerolineae bacterium]PWB56730.1 MAG: pyruvate ferredoxin oxidoreductase [Anaerolineales bacterium]
MLFTPGHRACPGCGATIAVRAILEATGPDVIVVSPTGCLETFSAQYPYSPWGVPWLHVLFENAGAVASGVEAALKKRGLADKVKVVIIGGDGGTHDIGLGALSGMLERGHNVTYICYDNEAYMNTGVQRSSSTPVGASTATSPVGKQSWGKERPKKNLPAIVMAHGAPYVATASIAYPKDITRKVKQALSIEGPKYIEIHSPCPIGWGFESASTIELAKLAVQTGLVPIYEAFQGQPLKVRKIPKRVPVTEYLRGQKRFRHLVEGEGDELHIAQIQAIADANAAHYGL